MSREYTISELASEFDVTTRTIRFYEEKGLLNPSRDGTRRIYSAADRTTLRLILRGKRLGFSLDESAAIISMYDSPSGNRRQLETLVAKIREKRAVLEQQMTDLKLTLLDLETSEKKCLEVLGSRKTRNETP